MLTGNTRELRPNLKLVTAPTTEPVTVAEFDAHAETAGLGKSDKIEDFLISARQQAEEWTGRAFITQTWQVAYDFTGPGPYDDYWYRDFARWQGAQMPRLIELPRPPLIAVTGITYHLDDGVEASTTFATTEYSVSTNALYGRVMLKTGKTWPVGLRPMDSLIITFTAGYGNAAAVPQLLKEGIIEWASHMYENREGQQAANAGGAVVLNRGAFVPAGVQAKLGPYRLPRL